MARCYLPKIKIYTNIKITSSIILKSECYNNFQNAIYFLILRETKWQKFKLML